MNYWITTQWPLELPINEHSGVYLQDARRNFYVQDSIRISDHTPDISAYLHFRVRSFKAFVRLENLNTAQTNGGFGFTNNNLAAPGYPYPGLQFRLGIYWSFVN